MIHQSDEATAPSLSQTVVLTALSSLLHSTSFTVVVFTTQPSPPFPPLPSPLPLPSPPFIPSLFPPPLPSPLLTSELLL